MVSWLTAKHHGARAWEEGGSPRGSQKAERREEPGKEMLQEPGDELTDD